jgi:hypothetical protein
MPGSLWLLCLVSLGLAIVISVTVTLVVVIIPALIARLRSGELKPR